MQCLVCCLVVYIVVIVVAFLAFGCDVLVDDRLEIQSQRLFAAVLVPTVTVLILSVAVSLSYPRVVRRSALG